MKYFSLILICILLSCTSSYLFSQEEEEYPSKEEDKYDDSLRTTWEYKEFAPVSIETAKNNKYDYVKIVKVDNPVIYNSRHMFPEGLDSIIQSTEKNPNDFKKFDSIMTALQNEKIGIIPKMSVIKQEKNGNNWAIIYTDSKYDDFIYGGWGYWLALSNDDGKTWKKYYTGLTENCYYSFKRKSKIALWKDSNTLQIEAAIVRQISEVVHPMPAQFEAVQDSIAVQIDISQITKDSDNDGLTDIVENKMMLNPNNPDSDSDGIVDGEDKNPRFKSIKTEKALIYQTLIEIFRPNDDGEMVLNIAKPPVYQKSEEDSLYGSFETVNIFVTDDKDLQGLELQGETMIIMSSKEYKDYELKYPSHSIECSYSPMFKCDGKKDTYKIVTSEFTGGTTYIIKKIKKGWKIIMLGGWIS
ncbi:MAG: hypothetical protein WCR42_16115 [bacterium]